MKIALDTNAYSDFMRGDPHRVDLLRAAEHILLPLVVLGELRAGFAAGNQQSSNATNLQRFKLSDSIHLPAEGFSVVWMSCQTVFACIAYGFLADFAAGS